MLEALNDATVRLMDFVVGWLLYMPKDAALVIIAVATAVLMTAIRPWTTNQEFLLRCKLDKKKLKASIKEAKKAKDKDAILRYRTTIGQIGLKAMKPEGKPMLIIIVPIALLAMWALARLGYDAPKPEETVKVVAFFPAAAVDNVVHMTPADGVTAKNGWVQRITEKPELDPAGMKNGWATWELTAAKNDKPYELEIRYQGKTFKREFIVDGRRYSPVIQFYDDPSLQAVQLDLTPYKPFGVIPPLVVKAEWFTWTRWLSWLSWLSILSLDAWLFTYLLIAIPLVFGLRWALKIN